MILGGYASLVGIGLVTIGAAAFGMNRGDVPRDTHTKTYIVQAGDTLWGISNRFDSRDNTDAVESWIEQKNRIITDIQPGQTIVVPVRR
ncbi:LysM peptidoglycan-binding domain-containing protein [Alicyclobacillus fastidiosus]|uniref:LysM peptidoglycan-binding domain-containing protein n=1 Tax=Alicyclobacillus fastidiosus TaxID=392011 RepID=A0ABV5A9U0_9BACL|nr:LysM peptidoglycan-binding domain-containing protein [Alicyclobacillus fastidiosus]WEH10951.1 LysM peptidoglycan-binding domain-containing protein [Alicyclobacillus fastidiosus]